MSLTQMERVPGATAEASSALDRHILRFSGAIIGCALLLQRFGSTSGKVSLNIVAPIGLLLMTWAVVAGVFVFNRRALGVYLTMCFFVFTSTVMSTIDNGGFGKFSILGLLQFLALGSFATLTFAEPIDEIVFFRLVNRWIAVVAAAGLIEFILQFVGLELFSFSAFLPEQILVERHWNVTIPIGDTPYFKSNGFFLLEPSILSQFVGLALVIEILLLRRARYLFLFGAALVASVSGTGWLIVIAFILTTVFSLGLTGVLLSAATLVVVGLALGGIAYLNPDIYLALTSRTVEFYTPGSSGFLRFTTPWWFASDVLHGHPKALMFGIGAGLSAQVLHQPSYDYDVNSVVKLFVEYGLPTLLTFFALFFAGNRTRVQNALVAPVMVWVFSNGAYVEMAFILFPAMLVIVTARLIEATPETRQAIR